MEDWFFKRHRGWFKAVAILVIVTFMSNELSFAFDLKGAGGSTHTLSPYSSIKPMVTPDGGMGKDTADLAARLKELGIARDFQESATLAYSVQYIGKLLDLYKGSGMGVDAVETALKDHVGHVDLSKIKLGQIEEKEGVFYIPCVRAEDKREQIISYSAEGRSITLEGWADESADHGLSAEVLTKAGPQTTDGSEQGVGSWELGVGRKENTRENDSELRTPNSELKDVSEKDSESQRVKESEKETTDHGLSAEVLTKAGPQTTTKARGERQEAKDLEPRASGLEPGSAEKEDPDTRYPVPGTRASDIPQMGSKAKVTELGAQDGLDFLKAAIEQKLSEKKDIPVTVLIKGRPGTGKTSLRKRLTAWLKKGQKKRVEFIDQKRINPNSWTNTTFENVRRQYSTHDVIIVEAVNCLPADAENLDIFVSVKVREEAVRRHRLRRRAYDKHPGLFDFMRRRAHVSRNMAGREQMEYDLSPGTVAITIDNTEEEDLDTRDSILDTRDSDVPQMGKKAEIEGVDEGSTDHGPQTTDDKEKGKRKGITEITKEDYKDESQDAELLAEKKEVRQEELKTKYEILNTNTIFGTGDFDSKHPLVTSGRILASASYDDINGMTFLEYARERREAKGVRRIYFDLDLTVFRSKGYLSSSAWFERVFKEFGKEQTLNWWGNIGHESRQIENGFFYRLMESAIPDMVKALREDGFEAIGLTARDFDKDQDRTEEILSRFGISMDEVIFTSGSGRKGEVLDKYETERDGKAGTVPAIFVEDSFGNLEQVLTGRDHVEGMYYKPATASDEDNWDYRTYKDKAEKAFISGDIGEAFEYYFNAVVKLLELNGIARDDAYRPLHEILLKLIILEGENPAGYEKLLQILEIAVDGRSYLFHDDKARAMRPTKGEDIPQMGKKARIAGSREQGAGSEDDSAKRQAPSAQLTRNTQYSIHNTNLLSRFANEKALWINVHGFAEDVEEKESREITAKKNLGSLLFKTHDVGGHIEHAKIHEHVRNYLDEKNTKRIILSGHWFAFIRDEGGCMEKAVRGICDAFGEKPFELVLPLDLIDNLVRGKVTIDWLLDPLRNTRLHRHNSVVYMDDEIVEEWSEGITPEKDPIVVRFYTSSEKMVESLKAQGTRTPGERQKAKGDQFEQKDLEPMASSLVPGSDIPRMGKKAKIEKVGSRELGVGRKENAQDNASEPRTPKFELTGSQGMSPEVQEVYDAQKSKLKSVSLISGELLDNSGGVIGQAELSYETHLKDSFRDEALEEDDPLRELLQKEHPILELINEMLEGSEKVVWADVGPGYGIALRQGKSIFGKKLVTYGVDPVDWLEELKKDTKSFAVFQASIGADIFEPHNDYKRIPQIMELALLPEPADIITAYRSVQYSKNPLATIKGLYNQLKPGGVLIVAGPVFTAPVEGSVMMSEMTKELNSLGVYARFGMGFDSALFIRKPDNRKLELNLKVTGLNTISQGRLNLTLYEPRRPGEPLVTLSGEALPQMGKKARVERVGSRELGVGRKENAQDNASEPRTPNFELTGSQGLSPEEEPVEEEVSYKLSRVRELLLDGNNRPEPGEISEVSYDDIIEAARQVFGETFGDIDGYLEYLKSSQTMSVEILNLLPYVEEVVKHIIQEYPDHTILVAARDGEIFYDGLKVVYEGMERSDKVQMIPASETFMSYLENSRMFGIDFYDHRLRFLQKYGITPEAIKRGEKFLIVDTGFRGSIARRLKKMAAQVYKSQIPQDAVEKAFDTGIMASWDPQKVDDVYSEPMVSFNVDRRDLADMFPRAITKVPAGAQKSPGYYTNIVLATAAQLMPRYHEEYRGTRNVGEAMEIYPKTRDRIQGDIDDAVSYNSSVINPIAAMLVQKRVTEYFKASFLYIGMRKQAYEEIREAFRNKERLDLRITGIERYVNGEPSGFVVYYKGVKGFVPKSCTLVDFSGKDGELECFIGVETEMEVLSPGEVGVGIDPKFSILPSKNPIRESKNIGPGKRKPPVSKQIPNEKRSKVNRMKKQGLRRENEERMLEEMEREASAAIVLTDDEILEQDASGRITMVRDDFHNAWEEYSYGSKYTLVRLRNIKSGDNNIFLQFKAGDPGIKVCDILVDNKEVGFLTYNTRKHGCEYIYVDPAMRGKGIAQTLFNWMAKRAKRDGAEFRVHDIKSPRISRIARKFFRDPIIINEKDTENTVYEVYREGYNLISAAEGEYIGDVVISGGKLSEQPFTTTIPDRLVPVMEDGRLKLINRDTQKEAGEVIVYRSGEEIKGMPKPVYAYLTKEGKIGYGLWDGFALEIYDGDKLVSREVYGEEKIDHGPQTTKEKEEGRRKKEEREEGLDNRYEIRDTDSEDKIPRMGKKAKIEGIDGETTKEKETREEGRDTRYEIQDTNKKLSDGSPYKIFTILRSKEDFIFPEEIRLETRDRTTDGTLSIETVKRALNTLADLGLAERFGIGEDAVYTAAKLDPEEWYLVKDVLRGLGARPTRAEKQAARLHLQFLQGISDGIDTRPVNAKLLHPVYVSDDMAVRRTINQDGKPLVAVYGGAGTDISNFLLSTDAKEAYFVSYNEDLDVFTPPDIDDYKILEAGSLAQSYWEDDPLEYNRKFNVGFSAAWNIVAGYEKIQALARELNAIDAYGVKVDMNKGYPRLRFWWDYHGEEAKEREITFIETDITRPEGYPELLKNVLKKGIDVYYQRAGLRIPRAYIEEDSFIEYINKHLRSGGFFVTDDFSFREDGMKSIEIFTARQKDFPIDLPIIDVPGRDVLRGAVARTRKWMPSRSYGWEVTVRQKTDKPDTRYSILDTRDSDVPQMGKKAKVTDTLKLEGIAEPMIDNRFLSCLRIAAQLNHEIDLAKFYRLYHQFKTKLKGYSQDGQGLAKFSISHFRGKYDSVEEFPEVSHEEARSEQDTLKNDYGVPEAYNLTIFHAQVDLNSMEHYGSSSDDTYLYVSSEYADFVSLYLAAGDRLMRNTVLHKKIPRLEERMKALGVEESPDSTFISIYESAIEINPDLPLDDLYELYQSHRDDLQALIGPESGGAVSVLWDKASHRVESAEPLAVQTKYSDEDFHDPRLATFERSFYIPSPYFRMDHDFIDVDGEAEGRRQARKEDREYLVVPPEFSGLVALYRLNGDRLRKILFGNSFGMLSVFRENTRILGSGTRQVSTGNKEDGFLIFERHGLPYPPGLALSEELVKTILEHPFLEEKEFTDLLISAVIHLGFNRYSVEYSVRSNPKRSMPGIFKTVNANKLEGVRSAIREVAASWYSEKARQYRERSGIGESYDLPIIVQQYVSGEKYLWNEKKDSMYAEKRKADHALPLYAVGSFSTRDPNTNEKIVCGEYLENAKGEDLMDGSCSGIDIRELAQDTPDIYAQILDAAKELDEYEGPQEVEFVVSDGKLYYLQTRRINFSPQATAAYIKELKEEGQISEAQAIAFLDAMQDRLGTRTLYKVKDGVEIKPLARGLTTSPGAMSGYIAWNTETARKLMREKKPIIFISHEGNRDEVMSLILEYPDAGLVTNFGNSVYHEGSLTRSAGIPAIIMAGAKQWRLSGKDQGVDLETMTVREGDRIIIDGDHNAILPFTDGLLEESCVTRDLLHGVDMSKFKREFISAYVDEAGDISPEYTVEKLVELNREAEEQCRDLQGGNDRKAAIIANLKKHYLHQLLLKRQDARSNKQEGTGESATTNNEPRTTNAKARGERQEAKLAGSREQGAGSENEKVEGRRKKVEIEEDLYAQDARRATQDDVQRQAPSAKLTGDDMPRMGKKAKVEGVDEKTTDRKPQTAGEDNPDRILLKMSSYSMVFCVVCVGGSFIPFVRPFAMMFGSMAAILAVAPIGALGISKIIEGYEERRLARLGRVPRRFKEPPVASHESPERNTKYEIRDTNIESDVPRMGKKAKVERDSENQRVKESKMLGADTITVLRYDKEPRKMVGLRIVSASALDEEERLKAAKNLTDWLRYSPVKHAPVHIQEIRAYRSSLEYGDTENIKDLYLVMSEDGKEVEGWVDLNVDIGEKSIAVMENAPWNKDPAGPDRRYQGVGHELRSFGIRQLLAKYGESLYDEDNIAKIVTLGHRETGRGGDVFDGLTIDKEEVEGYLNVQRSKRVHFMNKYGFNGEKTTDHGLSAEALAKAGPQTTTKARGERQEAKLAGSREQGAGSEGVDAKRQAPSAKLTGAQSLEPEGGAIPQMGKKAKVKGIAVPERININDGAVGRIAKRISDKSENMDKTLVVGIDGDKHVFKSTYTKALLRRLNGSLSVKLIDTDDYYEEGWYMGGALVRDESWDWMDMARDIRLAYESGEFDVILVEGYELYKIASAPGSSMSLQEFDVKINLEADKITRQWVFQFQDGLVPEKASDAVKEWTQVYSELTTIEYDFVVDTSIDFWKVAEPEVVEIFIEEFGVDPIEATFSLLPDGGVLPKTGALPEEKVFEEDDLDKIEMDVKNIIEYTPLRPLISECELVPGSSEAGTELDALFNVQRQYAPAGKYIALFSERQIFAIARFDAEKGACDIITITGKDMEPGGPVDYWVKRRNERIWVNPVQGTRDMVGADIRVKYDKLVGVDILLRKEELGTRDSDIPRMGKKAKVERVGSWELGVGRKENARENDSELRTTNSELKDVSELQSVRGSEEKDDATRALKCAENLENGIKPEEQLRALEILTYSEEILAQTIAHALLLKHKGDSAGDHIEHLTARRNSDYSSEEEKQIASEALLEFAKSMARPTRSNFEIYLSEILAMQDVTFMNVMGNLLRNARISLKEANWLAALQLCKPEELKAEDREKAKKRQKNLEFTIQLLGYELKKSPRSRNIGLQMVNNAKHAFELNTSHEPRTTNDELKEVSEKESTDHGPRTTKEKARGKRQEAKLAGSREQGAGSENEKVEGRRKKVEIEEDLYAQDARRATQDDARRPAPSAQLMGGVPNTISGLPVTWSVNDDENALRVAGVQLVCSEMSSKEEFADELERIAGVLQDMATLGEKAPDLVVFPEMIWGADWEEGYIDESFTEKYISRIRETSKSSGIAVAFGVDRVYLDKTKGDISTIRYICITPDDEIQEVEFHKSQVLEERRTFTVKGHKVGVMICCEVDDLLDDIYDELIVDKFKDTDLILVAAEAYFGQVEHWGPILRNAFEQPVMVVNRATGIGVKMGESFYGTQDVALRGEEGIIMAEVRAQENKSTRALEKILESLEDGIHDASSIYAGNSSIMDQIADSITEICLETGQYYEAFFGVSPESANKADLVERAIEFMTGDNKKTFLAIENGLVAGFITISMDTDKPDGGDAQLYNLAVREDMQGKRLGSMLLDGAVESIWSSGIRKFSFDTKNEKVMQYFRDRSIAAETPKGPWRFFMKRDLVPAGDSMSVDIEIIEKDSEIQRFKESDRKELNTKYDILNTNDDPAQKFVDALIVHIERQVMKNKKRGEKLIIGIDTSWIPEEQRSLAGMQMLLRKIESISRSRVKGFKDLRIVVDDDPDALTRELWEARKENGEIVIPLSNILILGEEDMLSSEEFEIFKGEKREEGAVFGKIVLPKDFSQNTKIDLLAVLAVFLAQTSVPGESKEFYIELPPAGELPLYELTDEYKLDSRALVMA